MQVGYGGFSPLLLLGPSMHRGIISKVAKVESKSESRDIMFISNATVYPGKQFEIFSYSSVAFVTWTLSN